LGILLLRSGESCTDLSNYNRFKVTVNALARQIRISRDTDVTVNDARTRA
jgi:hypothetical protein